MLHSEEFWQVHQAALAMRLRGHMELGRATSIAWKPRAKRVDSPLAVLSPLSASRLA